MCTFHVSVCECMGACVSKFGARASVWMGASVGVGAHVVSVSVGGGRGAHACVAICECVRACAYVGTGALYGLVILQAIVNAGWMNGCLLYTSDAADD